MKQAKLQTYLMVIFIHPQRDECGDPIDPNSLFCYRMDQLGKKSLVPPLLCHQLPKPTRLPCTTPSPPSTPSTRPSTPTELPKTTKTVKKKPSQAIQAQCSLLLTTLALLLQLTCAAQYSSRQRVGLSYVPYTRTLSSVTGLLIAFLNISSRDQFHPIGLV